MGKFIDMVGKRFSRLVVIEKSGLDSSGSWKWLCECDCGNKTIVCGIHLRDGHTISCGCYNKENNLYTQGSGGHLTHTMSKKRVYDIWSGIIKRCKNIKSTTYKNYGGRGITVCDKWLKFEGFWEDMQEGYSDELTIDRIDVNGNYEKSNCRWATVVEQSRNKRNNINIVYNGKSYILADLASEYKIPYGTLRYRIQHGWTIKKAIITPIQ